MKDNKNVIHILVLLIIVFVLNCCGETYKSGERESERRTYLVITRSIWIHPPKSIEEI